MLHTNNFCLCSWLNDSAFAVAPRHVQNHAGASSLEQCLCTCHINFAYTIVPATLAGERNRNRIAHTSHTLCATLDIDVTLGGAEV